jgi:hypothetical protein
MSEDICAICHDELGPQAYTIPDCNHQYHPNCIITWFRTGKDRCPLCNNMGINTIEQMIGNSNWNTRRAAFENYKKMRVLSRKKDAPKQLKKMIKHLKKIEEKHKDNCKQQKEFRKQKHPDLTGSQVYSTIIKYRRRGWKTRVQIRRYKELIGFQQRITNIIIPVKIIV